ncbi:MAG: DUF2513 domain-containing protein [Gammaproteobacteria bacterium]|nr:DUF2513 domain-containing protein [Gammaproteobacteria bacterium]
MEFDEDLIYAILKWRESVQEIGRIAPPDLPDWTRHQICYHAKLCRERGLIQDYFDVKSNTGRNPEIQLCRIGALSWAGQEELKRMRAARR